MRTLAAKKSFDLKSFFFQWEWMLVIIFIVVFAINTSLSEYFLDGQLLVAATSTFLDKAFLVLPMVFIIILGDIDISVASTVALSSVVMAVSYNSGLPMPLAVVLCLAVSTTCGFVNGYLITKFKELSAVIVTLSTMIIYRGIALIILKDQASGKFPEWFGYLGWAASESYRLFSSYSRYLQSSSSSCCIKRLSADAFTEWEAMQRPVTFPVYRWIG